MTDAPTPPPTDDDQPVEIIEVLENLHALAELAELVPRLIEQELPDSLGEAPVLVLATLWTLRTRPADDLAVDRLRRAYQALTFRSQPRAPSTGSFGAWVGALLLAPLSPGSRAEVLEEVGPALRARLLQVSAFNHVPGSFEETESILAEALAALHRRHQEAEWAAQAQALRELAAPAEQLLLTPYRVLFEGSDPFAAGTQALSALTVARAEHAPTPRDLRAWLEARGFRVGDSGAGEDGWDLHVVATFAQAQDLAEAVEGTAFARFRDAGVTARLVFDGFDHDLPATVIVCPHVWEGELIDAARVRELYRDDDEGVVRVLCASDEDDDQAAVAGAKILCLPDFGRLCPALSGEVGRLPRGTHAARTHERAPWAYVPLPQRPEQTEVDPDADDEEANEKPT